MPTTRERPWLRYYGAVPPSIDYPRVTLYEAVAATAQRSPDAIAWEFFGTTATYRELPASIDSAAAALASLGLKACDRLLISMPTAPAGVIAFYAAAILFSGGKSILVPQFSAEIVARLLKTARPNLLVGVPTLYDALSKDPRLAKSDLSCLRACFSGADTLPRPVKERFEALVAAHGGKVKLLEGYGLTEAVTAIMAMPLAEYREGSIGIPFPDMDVTICRFGTTDELPPGEEGEICIAGPAVMAGYLDDPQANAETLKVHADGRTWLHTGDLGRRDDDGFFYFTVHAKRMIKSSGFNVYPAQVESVLYQHPAVLDACVIGVPDEAQVERVKAVVALKDPAQESELMARALIDLCRERLIKWSCRREVEFRRELPKTRVGKIDFKVLVAEHNRKAVQ